MHKPEKNVVGASLLNRKKNEFMGGAPLWGFESLCPSPLICEGVVVVEDSCLVVGVPQGQRICRPPNVITISACSICSELSLAHVHVYLVHPWCKGFEVEQFRKSTDF